MPAIGDVVRPNPTFYHRPICRVVTTGVHPRLGSYFVAEYPNGDCALQYESETGAEARFEPMSPDEVQP